MIIQDRAREAQDRGFAARREDHDSTAWRLK
jgi:hypothetical protein